MLKSTKNDATGTQKEVCTLKLYNVRNFLDSAESLFQYFIPLNEKHFWPFTVLNNGSFKSIEVFPRYEGILTNFSKQFYQILTSKTIYYVKYQH